LVSSICEDLFTFKSLEEWQKPAVNRGPIARIFRPWLGRDGIVFALGILVGSIPLPVVARP
jgi:hypothetical protein